MLLKRLSYFRSIRILFRALISATSRFYSALSHSVMRPSFGLSLPPSEDLGSVSLRLMTSQLKDIVNHKSVKYIFCGLWVQNWCEISEVPPEFAHQISNPFTGPYIVKCPFNELSKYWRLMSLSERCPCLIKPEPKLVSKLCVFACLLRPHSWASC